MENGRTDDFTQETKSIFTLLMTSHYHRIPRFNSRNFIAY